MTFKDFNLHPKLLRGIEGAGFSQPTPIQAQAIPSALNGEDVLACAMTGSGKTAAFLLPILQRLVDRPRGVTRALILAPTRELAAQIAEECARLGRHTGLRCATIVGGVSHGPQVRALASGVEVVVATPGRLIDHLAQSHGRLAGLEVLVLDEADRMLDMGFLPAIRRILAHLPARRQTLFFSATLPGPIVSLAREILHQPVTISQERRSAPATGVVQSLYPVAQNLKARLLLALLEHLGIRRAIVFARTKHRANRLAEFLIAAGVRCDRIHGNRSQAQRTQALAGFRSGEFQVLVATDIAARGIDIEALDHVINFDVPMAAEDYIHRVGRTARAERTGDALTLVAPDEEDRLRAIERTLGKRLPRLKLDGFDYTPSTGQALEIPLHERLAAMRASRTQAPARAPRTGGSRQPQAGDSRRRRVQTRS